ncbi:nicotinate-nucleotide--dimethylbenzimidazole phosphoribosyltransferase [Deferribacter desulfuricans SSM1]|uniref:Nicotinate-nucleotide--dimethylbenzimidazole phosphoribosyltransferase n=1 Tax=Deferribacter desulfuricans (strain DSM 14783 / JCM 11476 / NBRC 101012 / SSM1) TaxID=639282 RepID=D3P9V9_DEFDS|nr:nicotinate-nucleotide--dimethylbenzimidazole phosphoribosyltransferase [Deferribacter desulfuricans]BAI81499.1 nicotinate-nucleotide--dimethylbenzimidazole phosphoribosyltransferase [Deferribacter desulfuricans SSM1]
MRLENILKEIAPTNQEIFEKAKERTSNLIMPYRAMGMLNDISEKVCAIKETLKPSVNKRAVFVMAGDHGVVEEGVSAFPQQVTCEMIKAFVNDIATITVLARQNNCSTIVADVGSKCNISEKELKGSNKFIVKKVKYRTNNFTKEPAMTREEAEKSIMTGFEIASEEIKSQKLDVIATGDMGIGNTTPSSAIGAVITGKSVEEMTGKGTGITSDLLQNKINVIKTGINLHKPNPDDAIDILSKVGGIEIGAIAGVILAGAYHKIPVIIDGLISTAGALIAYKLCPTVKEYMFAGHISEEPGHKYMLEYLGLSPLLRLNMRLGEGTGAVLAMHILDAAVKIITEVATFEEAGVSKSDI